MKEPVLEKKIKINNISFKEYLYFVVIGFILVLGVSYGFSFFKQNSVIKNDTLEINNSITSVSQNINLSGLEVQTDIEGIKSNIYNLTVNNNSDGNSKYQIIIEQDSGVENYNMRYGVFVNNILVNISSIPENGVLFESNILKNTQDSIKISLWQGSTSSETTFVGTISSSIERDSVYASDYFKTMLGNNYNYGDEISNNYVSFDCNDGTCSSFRIVGIDTNNRLVITNSTNYTNAAQRTTDNLYYGTDYHDSSSLVYAESNDNSHLNVYLVKTVKIIGGTGKDTDPYILDNDLVRVDDRKANYTITYKDDNVTQFTQPLFVDYDNYIGYVMSYNGFIGWYDGTNEYSVGDSVTFNSNKVLSSTKTAYAQVANLRTSNVAYVKTYSGNDSQDTVGVNNNKQAIYYLNDEDGTTGAASNGNVLFGGICWQIVRTTDTGGVKLIYNGPSENSQCLTSRANHLGVVGSNGVKSTDLSGVTIFGKSYTYDNSKFTLQETFTSAWNDTNYKSLIGTYVCLTPMGTCTEESCSCTTLTYVGHYQDSSHASTTSYTLGNNHYSQIGSSAYNAYFNSPALVGYMYNDVYNYQVKNDFATVESVLKEQWMGANYYVGSEITLNNGTYQLSGTTFKNSTYTDFVGKYTLLKGGVNDTATTAYYISGMSGGTAYLLTLNSTTPSITHNNAKLSYGDSITLDNGVYILNNKAVINKTNWYSNYSALNNKYVCNGDTTSCASPKKVTTTGSTAFTYINHDASEPMMYYGKSFTYSNGTYTLTDTVQNKWSSLYNGGLQNAHYTCFSGSGITCTGSIYYIYYTTNYEAYYVTIKQNEKIEDVLNKMINYKTGSLTDNLTINKYNSAIKGTLDNWFKKEMLDYEGWLENTVFCNDRTVETITGWSPTANTRSSLTIRFTPYSYGNNLACTNSVDRFSKDNEVAELDYSVGLLTKYERTLLGTSYASTWRWWWLASPYYFNYYSAVVRYVNADGSGGTNGTAYAGAVRAVVSLKPDAYIISGTGAYNNPYVINTTS